MTNKNDKESNLSDAARIMRTSSDPKERSEAASKMGHVGGSHSHDNDQNRRNNNNNKDDNE